MPFMKALDLYYSLKPAIPRRVQIALRRTVAARKKKYKAGVWPINPDAAKKPEGWMGWPNRKRFAVVLNHDVDKEKGLRRCASLMEIERMHDFRSAFNFVPEGYFLPQSLRRDLHDAGFEIGVHGLKHDGKHFKNPEGFSKNALKINHYLKEWGAAAFTSPAMLRNFDLQAQLNIEHGCSTFDTDPFEPQSKGVCTIFPFYAGKAPRTYLELPYTLPQDHCLYVILREKDTKIWRDKLEWIAENGGMALLNTHPDYMNFDATRCSLEEYPVGFYIRFLEHIRSKYAGQYWHALPREVSLFWKEAYPIKSLPKKGGTASTHVQYVKKADRDAHNSSEAPIKIWIDLDNTPHVPFFIPIIRALEHRGYKIILTARDAYQVCELAEKRGLEVSKVGRHYGKHRIWKTFGLFVRSAQLLSFYRAQRPQIAISHGSRSHVVTGKLVGIPTIAITDYEHARTVPFGQPRWVIVPDALSFKSFSVKICRFLQYPGLKEDVYVSDFEPDPALVEQLCLEDKNIIIAVRPPADTAHYYVPESGVLFDELMSRIAQSDGVTAVLLPRNKKQAHHLKKEHPNWFLRSNVIVPSGVVDGLNLLWHSDLVVGGGGTMNREAAALGLPVYSIFKGKMGAVDRMLEREGRLIFIEKPEEVCSKIRFEKRARDHLPERPIRPALAKIVSHIEYILQIEMAEGHIKAGSKQRP